MSGDLLFVQTNNPAGNQVLVCDLAADGALEVVETVDTDGDGGAHDGKGPRHEEPGVVQLHWPTTVRAAASAASASGSPGGENSPG